MLTVDMSTAGWVLGDINQKENKPLLGDSGLFLLRNYLIKKEQSKENVLCT